MEREADTEIMEGLPVVCYFTGTMNSVLDKLTKLRNHSNPADEFSLLAESLKNDLWSLKENFVDKLFVRRVTQLQLKVCMKQVRELVFNIEDWIDQEPETNLVENPSGRQKFQYFRAKIHAARERLTWYFDLFEIVSTETGATPTQVTINPRLLAEEKSCHGVLDGPREELLKHLTDDGGHQMRKVVSVVGREGLGKTTLAKQIYSELQLRQLFQCQAFVSVGRRSAMRETLEDIIRQVDPWSINLLRGFVDVQEIITELREYLGTKRYFIVVDGIWSTSAWKIINCVLPNNLGCRGLITTCIIDVARSCSSYPNDIVYEMAAFNEENSRILFLSKTITLQEEKWGEFEEDAYYMLKMCDGMPLAIVVAAGLLLTWKSKAPAEQKMLQESIYSPSEQYSTFDGMTKILHMSYADLSLPLRSCFLYLSVFQEKYTIKKDHLIWLWGAQGFVPKSDKECLWVIGERYFNELISRRLIQPVFSYEDDQAVGCTVHNVVLDFIRNMSREENFATGATELSCGPFPCDTIRRFSLDCGSKDEAGTLCTSSVHLSSMRSLSVSGDVEGKLDPLARTISMINLLAFKLLRVLDLEDTKNLGIHHLEGIGGLALLRYLGLAGTGMNLLPKAITELEQLETLDLRRNGRVMYFPTSIVRLQKLTHLLLDEVDAKDVWEMQELEAVSGIHVENNGSLGKVVELLRKSARLRMLGLTLKTSVPSETDLISFVNEVAKSKIQSLSLDFRFGYEGTPLLVDSWEKVTTSLENKFEPQRFELKINGRYLERVPPNMGSFASLTHFRIQLSEAKAEDFHVLGGLNTLVLLNLSASRCLASGRFIIKGGIFPSLKVFSFRILHSWMCLEFEEGAMPQLQRLDRVFQVCERMDQAYPDIGMEHLTGLTRVHATFNCHRATVSEVEVVEAAIREQVSKMATKPALALSRENDLLIKKDETGEDKMKQARHFIRRHKRIGRTVKMNDQEL